MTAFDGQPLDAEIEANPPRQLAAHCLAPWWPITRRAGLPHDIRVTERANVLCDQVSYGVHPFSAGIERPPGLAVLDQPSGIAQLPNVSHRAGLSEFGVGLVEGSTDAVPQEGGEKCVEVALGQFSVDAGAAEGIEEGRPTLILAVHQMLCVLGLLMVSM